jgi:RNase P subunit RPR2
VTFVDPSVTLGQGSDLRVPLGKGVAVQLNQEQIAADLGLAPHQITDVLLNKVAEDELFLYHLKLCKHDPQLLEILMREVRPQNAPPQEQRTSELLGRASSALTRWAVSGFKRVDQTEYQRRLATCQACEHLIAPPKNALYRLVSASQEAKTVCGLCGCDVRRKAWLATEHCPDDKWATEPRDDYPGG